VSGAEWAPLAMLALGAWHGLNPGMGWLFAAALGMQEGRTSGVWRALPPLALGHALAVAVTVAAVAVVGLALPAAALRTGVGALLVGYGVLRLVWRKHPRFGGMRVGRRDLVTWSFLMATAHGAGLMVLPFLPWGSGGEGLAVDAVHAGHAAHAGHAGHAAAQAATLVPGSAEAWGAVLLHTGAYLLVTGLVALAVVAWLGLRWLRTLWVDLDRVWAVTLVITGLFTLAL
jgi:hypothetical protein